MGEQKTQASPFKVDQWEEDEKIYHAVNRRKQAERLREKREAKQKVEADNIVIITGLAEHDELEALRREKRILMDDQKKLEAQIGLEKVNRRIASVKRMQDNFRQQLESRPQLQGMCSDYCTMPIRKGDGHPPGAYLKPGRVYA